MLVVLIFGVVFGIAIDHYVVPKVKEVIQKIRDKVNPPQVK